MLPLALLLLQAQPSPLLRHCLAEWKRYPEMRAEDAYKWLYHATLGGEHAITSTAGAMSWMDNEWRTLGAPLANEPIIVKLTPNGSMIRVNLRPYRKSGGAKGVVLSAFIESAKRFKKSKAGFTDAWLALKPLLPIGKITKADWEMADALSKSSGYRAIEHSNEYLRAYRPAYRVVLASVWAKRRG